MGALTMQRGEFLVPLDRQHDKMLAVEHDCKHERDQFIAAQRRLKR